jgi:hypothetical protein
MHLHVVDNVKFVNAKQARKMYEYKNRKEKPLKQTAI